MGKIFNIDLNYTTHYEGIEANSEDEALGIALQWWDECMPNHTIACVHETIKRYFHPYSDEEFITFEDAKRDLLANYKEELHTNGWYWEAFKDMAEERDLDNETLYDLIYGTDEYRKDLFSLWEKILDEKACEIAIEEKEITI